MKGAAQDRKPTVRRCLLTFGILGPLVGWLIAFLQLALRRFESLESSFGAVVEVIFGFGLLSVVGIPISYVVGLVPTLLTGLAYWGLRRRYGFAPSIVATTIIGLLAAVLGAAIIWAAGSEYIDEELRMWRYYVLPGAVSAVACGLLSDRRSLFGRARGHSVETN